MTKTAAARKRAIPVEPVAQVVDPKGLIYDRAMTPSFDDKKLVDLYSNSLNSGHYAYWRFSDQNDSTGAGCHGYMHNASIREGWACVFRYGFNPQYRTVHGFDVKPEEIEPAYWWYINDFMLGETSPWKALVDKLTIVRNIHGVPIMYVVDGPYKDDIDKNLLQNFNIASRWPVEFPTTTKEVFELKNSLDDFTNEEAIILHYLVRYNPLLGIYMSKSAKTVGGYHHWIADGWDFTRFIERKPNSKMTGTKRFCSVMDAMSPTNDRYIWGESRRETMGIRASLTSGLTGSMKHITSRFGVKISTIDKEAFKAVLANYRAEMAKVLPATADTPVGQPGPKSFRKESPSDFVSFDSVYPHLKESK